MNPGAVENTPLEEIKKQYPEELKKHEEDPYNHRYPRAESYHDLAVKLEPIILELERESNDLLIIAHESVLRVLYGYLMACNAADIPFLSFPRDEITEVGSDFPFFFPPFFLSTSPAASKLTCGRILFGRLYRGATTIPPARSIFPIFHLKSSPLHRVGV